MISRVSFVLGDAGLIPNPDSFSEECAGRVLDTALDLLDSYSQQKLHPDSRDMTAFQTPIGVLRNVGLPMGYTNAVTIQQTNVTFILMDEMPEHAAAFIDDVVVKGPRSYYKKEDGTYETHAHWKSERRRFTMIAKMA